MQAGEVGRPALGPGGLGAMPLAWGAVRGDGMATVEARPGGIGAPGPGDLVKCAEEGAEGPAALCKGPGGASAVAQPLGHVRVQKGQRGAGRPLVGSGCSKDFFFRKIELTKCKLKQKI